MEAIILSFAATTLAGASGRTAADRFDLLVEAAKDLDEAGTQRLLQRLEDGRAFTKARDTLDETIRRIRSRGGAR